MHAFNCWVKFYILILRSFPVHLQCLLAHGGSANNKCFSRNCPSKNQMRLIDYELCFTLASSTQQYFSFIYFTAVFSVQRLLNVQKSRGGSSIISSLFRLIHHLHVYTSCKYMKYFLIHRSCSCSPLKQNTVRKNQTVCILCDHCSYGVLGFWSLVLIFNTGPPYALLNTPTRAADDTHRHRTPTPVGRSVYLDYKGVGRSIIQSRWP